MPVSADPRTTKSYREVTQLEPGTIIQYRHYVDRNEVTEFAVKRDDGTWSVAGVAEPIDNENFYYRIGDINWDGVTVIRALTDEEIDTIEARALTRAADFLDAAPLNQIATEARLDEHSSGIRTRRVIMTGIADYLRRRAKGENVRRDN